MVSNRLLALHVELVRSKLPLTIAGVMQSIGSGAGKDSKSTLHHIAMITQLNAS